MYSGIHLAHSLCRSFCARFLIPQENDWIFAWQLQEFAALTANQPLPAEISKL
jgi:hypothetical protein